MRKIFLLIFFTLLLISCNNNDKLNKKEIEIFKVKVKKFSYKKVPEKIILDGFVSSDKIAYLSPKIDGYIDKILVNVGDKVKKGDLLVIIKNKEIDEKVNFLKFKLQALKETLEQTKILINISKKSLKQAEANFILAKRNFNRYKNLFNSESITKQEFDRITTEYTNALLELEKSKDMLKINKLKLIQLKKEINSLKSNLNETVIISNYRYIKAPFSGIILEKYLDIGNLVKPGVKILKLGSNNLVAYISIPLKYREYVQKNSFLTIENAKVKILEISKDIAPSTSQFIVKTELPNIKKYFNGEYIKALLTTDTLDKLIIPMKFIKKYNDLYYTFICFNGYIVKSFLKGEETPLGFIVKSGLSPEDNVIISSEMNLKENSRCEIQ